MEIIVKYSQSYVPNFVKTFVFSKYIDCEDILTNWQCSGSKLETPKFFHCTGFITALQTTPYLTVITTKL